MKMHAQLVRGYVACDRSIERIRQAGRNVLRSYLETAMSAEELTELTLAVYARWFDSLQSTGGLFDWEREWFDHWLPAPPAHILVGAAGRGREVSHLLEAGYTVDAFEPVEEAFRVCRAQVGARGRVFRGTYGDLLRGEGPLGELVRHNKYDVVLMGWGSLSHVLGLAERQRLLEVLSRVVPQGPILASFLLGDHRDRRGHETVGRGERLGRMLGRLTGRLRGRRPDSEPIIFTSFIGVAHPLGVEEIEALGEHIGRAVSWETTQFYPHVAFVPQR